MEAVVKRYVSRMSVEVALRDLRNHTADLLQRVESGEELVITRRGKPVAMLTPIKEGSRRWMPKGEVIEILENFQADPDLWRELRGRPGESTDDDGLF